MRYTYYNFCTENFEIRKNLNNALFELYMIENNIRVYLCSSYCLLQLKIQIDQDKNRNVLRANIL